MTTSESDDNQLAARDRTVRRQRIVIVIACLAAAVSIAALVASLFVKSPQQRAAEVAPPPKDPVTAPVRNDVLTSQVITRGTVGAAKTVDVVAGPAPAGSERIVTSINTKVGATIKAGDVPLEMAGRPIFVLQGMVPAYRTLHQGDRGDDVEQLQRNLVTLGSLNKDQVSGWYGWTTSEAVARLYHAQGLEMQSNGVTSIPFGEVVFVNQLPAMVLDIPTTVGANIAAAKSGTVLTLSSAKLAVRGVVPEGSQTGLRAGQPVTITDAVNHREAKGTITSVGKFQAAAKDDD